MSGNNAKIFGDYQTPLYFAKQVCELIKKTYRIEPKIIIEPNCVQGNFLLAAREVFKKSELFGFDISKEYVEIAKKIFQLLRKISFVMTC